MWIETSRNLKLHIDNLVTSLAEVWIETRYGTDVNAKTTRSLPLRKCGLKLQHNVYNVFRNSVTSLAEVWIETVCNCLIAYAVGSHFPCGSVDWNMAFDDDYIMVEESLPLRKCGLKLHISLTGIINIMSLPLRKCGLKQNVACNISTWFPSLPLRKCGLKP